MDYEEFKEYVIQTKTKFQEYKVQIENLDSDVIDGLNNIEFIFRLDIMDNILNELSNMEELINN